MAPAESCAYIPAWYVGLLKLSHLDKLIQQPVKKTFFPWFKPGSTWLGWGAKPSGRSARRLAKFNRGWALTLEDGFLRSFGAGGGFPPLSVIVDDRGIYYDSTSSSALEYLLNGKADLLEGIEEQVAKAEHLILLHKLSKYNHAPALEPATLRPTDRGRVLVIDQTMGDLSVSMGGANASDFQQMYLSALSENPTATVYIKTHPDVISGRNNGYLTAHKDSCARTVFLTHDINPFDLLSQMDKVYTVTSTMGFEALLCSKPVVVFGRPWYAGWGVTDDRHGPFVRRTRSRNKTELFAAAYFHYTRYLNPTTRERGTIFDVIDWLVRQKKISGRLGYGRMFCVGFRRWKRTQVGPMLSLHPDRVHFCKSASSVLKASPNAQDRLVYWGSDPPPGLEAIAACTGAQTLRIEDGFVRSVGLGSDLHRPFSLVIDADGLYFDPARPSGLERCLNTRSFSAKDIERARVVRNFMVSHGITKYNTEPRVKASWIDRAGDQIVVLVPGQVEDDASIRAGCEAINSNLSLLIAARAAHPNSFIVYKPHPDVVAQNRIGALDRSAVERFADHVEVNISVLSCIEACDVVHTMTSQVGFDALLRGKDVVVHGLPFYAGWGLTVDSLKLGRRQRDLDLDELVAATLLHYPIYWDWELAGFTTCEATLLRILEMRADYIDISRSRKNSLVRIRRVWVKVKNAFFV